MAIASAAKEPLCVCEISMTASTKPSAHMVIGTPGQRMTSRFSGLSGLKLIRIHNGIGADRSQHFGNQPGAKLFRPRNGSQRPRPSRALDVQFFDVEVAQLGWSLETVVNQDAQESKNVARAVEVNAMLACQRLNRLELADVPLRKPPAVGRCPLGDYQAEVLVHHQGARVRLQDLGRNADRIDGFIQREACVRWRPTRYSFSQSSIPSERLVGVVRALMRYSCAPRRSPRATRSSSS